MHVLLLDKAVAAQEIRHILWVALCVAVLLGHVGADRLQETTRVQVQEGWLELAIELVLKELRCAARLIHDCDKGPVPVVERHIRLLAGLVLIYLGRFGRRSLLHLFVWLDGILRFKARCGFAVHNSANDHVHVEDSGLLRLPHDGVVEVRTWRRVVL